jgi:autotransporter-associated beta strand protein
VAGEALRPGKALTGPALPGRSVCAPGGFFHWTADRTSVLEGHSMFLNSLRKWTKRKSSAVRQGRRAATPRKQSFRPRLEALEDRLAPATHNWTGLSTDSSNWSDAANWAGNVAPSPGDDLIFTTGANRLANINNFASGTTFHSISFGGSGYTLSGNAITLGAGGLQVDAKEIDTSGHIIINVPVTGIDTINLGMTLSGAGEPFKSSASAATLQVGGVLSGTGGVTVTGPGSVEYTGTKDNTYSGVTTVVSGLLGLEAFSGFATVPGGLVIGTGTGHGNGTAQVADLNGFSEQLDAPTPVAVTINNDGLLNLAGSTDTIGALTLNGGIVETGSGTLFLAGNVTATSSTTSQGPSDSAIFGNLELDKPTLTFTVNKGPGPIDLDIAAVMRDPFIFPITTQVVKNGTGHLQLDGASTYAAQTFLNAGVTTLTNGSALGSSAAGSGTVVANTATIDVTGGVTINEPLTLEGLGANGFGTLQSDPSPPGVPNSPATWAGPITLGGTTVAVGNASPSSATLVLSGPISGAGNLTVEASTEVELTGTNSYSGTTKVAFGTLVFTNPSALGGNAAAPITVQSGTLSGQGNFTINRPLTLNGFGAGIFGALNGTITWAGPITLASNSLVGGLGGNLTLTGAISGPGALNVDNVVLSGNQVNTYTGGTFVDGDSLFLDKPGMNAIPGSLVIGGPGPDNLVPINNGAPPTEVVLLASEQLPPTASVTINGGILTDNAGPGSVIASETVGPLTLNGGEVIIHGTLTLNGTVTVQGSTTFPNLTIAAFITSPVALGAAVRTFNFVNPNAELLLEGPISGGTDALTINGPGQLEITDGGTYTGVTTVNNAILTIDGHGQPLQSQIIVGTGGLLQGTADASSAVAGISAVGGTVAPGQASPLGVPGLLTSNGNVSFHSASTFQAVFDGTTPGSQLGFSQLAVTGTVNLGNASPKFVLEFVSQVGDTFDIIPSTGRITGTFAGLPQKTIFALNDPNLNQEFFQIDYKGGTSGHDVVLTHVKPPQAMFQNRSITTPVTEGKQATLTGTIVDPNAHGTFLLRVDWGDGSLPQIFTFSADAGTVHVEHRYPDNPPGTPTMNYTIHLAWKDTLGPSRGAELHVAVDNPTHDGDDGDAR